MVDRAETPEIDPGTHGTCSDGIACQRRMEGTLGKMSPRSLPSKSIHINEDLKKDTLKNNKTSIRNHGLMYVFVVILSF